MCFSKIINPTNGLPDPGCGSGPDNADGTGHGAEDFDFEPANQCVKKPLVVFMGGAADSVGTVMFDTATDYKKGHASYQDIYYRSHDAGAHVLKLVEKYFAAGQKIAVIGHSWGGDSAVHNVALKTNAKIDILATLDPVSRFSSKPKAKPSSAMRYINVYINYSKADLSNLNNVIARAGGPWEEVSCANENIDFIKDYGAMYTSTPDHAWAEEMFNQVVKIEVEALK